MDLNSRYQLLEKIGSGNYATVFRGRADGGEVAIKQIHEQYLANPGQLDRYWQEVQLFRSLSHANIVTIFDIDRERGWLILELMQGNLAQKMEGRQMDLRALRTLLTDCLLGLKHLHSRGVVHGDIKPSNLMIDAHNRVKLGDFGLARRVSDEKGNLLKGTTKYMAPEVVSEDFGEIGPASDLYSLGFAAYELMCGPHFETLFPGLSEFGRGKHVAWMMWHAAADRRMPEIGRVLHGVPDDLTHVIQKLVEKDQKKRYQNADQALSDLNVDLKVAQNAGGDKQKKRTTIAVAAIGASLILTLAVAFFPSGNSKPTKIGPEKNEHAKLSGNSKPTNAPAEPKTAMSFDPATAEGGRSFAFLVAVSEYDRTELRSLQFPRNDIREFRDALIASGYDSRNIVLMQDDPAGEASTRFLSLARNVREELRLLLGAMHESDTLIVAFAGHGVQFRGEKECWFCPRDAKLTDRNTLISFDDILKVMDACRASRKLLLVDACRNDPQSNLGRSRAEVQLESVTRPQTLELPKSLLAIFSCGPGQQSFEDPEIRHGVFFHQVLRGWNGDADRDRDGRLQFRELEDYVLRKTAEYARMSMKALQTPQSKGVWSNEWTLRTLERPAAIR